MKKTPPSRALHTLTPDQQVKRRASVARAGKKRSFTISTLPPIDQPLALAWLSSPRPQVGDLDD